jgi:hypothetical protein
LQLRHRLRKLWHEIRDPACKMTLNWVTKTIRRITGMKAFERLETKNKQVFGHWPLSKSFMKRDRPKAPTAIHDPLDLKFLPSETANAIADYKINHIT